MKFFLLLSLLILAGCAPLSPEPLARGDKLPELTIVTLEGSRVNLRGAPGQALWVNFWASWCAPCREEWPDMNAAVHDVGPAVRIVAVAVNEPPTTVAAFVAEHPADFMVAVDPQGLLAKRFGVIGFPTHVLIDANGTVQQVVRGPLNAPRAADLLGIAVQEHDGP